ncbi:protein kinase subdomain-containing protein PKL/CAK/Fmp29 [Lentinus tigrinus ALCF2SS1-7]|uniref:Protein kinase subdomain-containing protein PKL/CAK/Fmp29 n=1 Tax=Lentinus tigrinus ALCF2SS1-6 TaxID=1328759 RepID=A0A5C2RUG1_9APHY|nr:protein kinase subdomain-containing protein PKL/CAK/Fmp29 [Lentinus tigrinus ALCF2SS1-6]RPD69305.1 protein kinase subdomain-containing protein PKL/CAK/Fmp29 [Lentinus tigrinus ALCF2SS1-7]
MSCLRRARLVSHLRAVPTLQPLRLHSSPRSIGVFSHSSSIATATRCLPRRTVSAMAHTPSDNDLFEYTSGRWLVNDNLRHAERRRVFNVDALRRLAAESVNRSPDDIESLRKLAEGGFNRVFLITMRDGFRMVARIPYPSTVPKYFAVASEAATLAFLHSFGVPTPEVYGYSPTPDNAAGTEYIFMQYIEGVSLGDVLSDLEEGNIISILRQLAELESSIQRLVFKAGGSLYFAEDLANVAGSPSGLTKPVVALQDMPRFCIGPETSLPLWFGQRSQLDVDRGPYATIEEALVRGAEKEQAYLRRFGRPLLPFQPARREAYGYQKQQPSDHIENLDRYLRIAPSLVSRDKRFDYFCIRHPDLQPNNILVSRSPDSNSYAIVGIIDWQHTSILPLSLHAGIPKWLQNNDGTGWQAEMPPSLPENLSDMDKIQRERELELYRRRFLHYYYAEHTRKYNIFHWVVLAEAVGSLRRRLFRHSRDPWEGETIQLKLALVQAIEHWEALAGEGVPCPIAFDPDDARETIKLAALQREADDLLEVARDKIGTVGSEDWVPAEHYEEVVARSKKLKEHTLSELEDDEERAQVAANWPFDDKDEEDYM